MPIFGTDSRPAGFYADAHDWPVGVKHRFTPQQVIDALNGAITAEKWADAKQSLRETTFEEWGVEPPESPALLME